MGHDAHTRRDPRFVNERQVQVVLPGREALAELWTKDISKGGLFVKTDVGLPPQTRVGVTLATPDGMLVLEAEVVHFLDPVVAAQIGHPAGVGLQFVNLDGPRREALDRYLLGLAKKLGDAPAASDAGPSTEMVLNEMRRVISRADGGDLYGALEVDENATTDAILLRIAYLKELFSTPPPEFPPPQVARLQLAIRTLERLGHVLASGQRRFDYDLQRKVTFTEARFFDAYSQGVSATTLRRLWENQFESKLRKAANYATQALEFEKTGNFKAAVEAGNNALAHDPFNLELQAAIADWQAKAS